MLSFNLGRWLKRWRRSEVKTFRRRPKLRLDLEELESRLAPALVWTGGGGAANNNWDNPANWQNGIIPTAVAPVDLVFNNSATFFTANNNIAGLTIANLTVASGSYTLTQSAGRSLILGDPSTHNGLLLVNTGASANISIDMQLGLPITQSEIFNVQAGAQLTITGQLSGSSATSLTKQGVGQLTLSQNNSTFLGSFKIDNSIGSNVVSITNPNALGAPLTSELQTFTIAGATAGTTKFRFTYPDGITNPQTLPITFTGTASDAPSIQVALNTLFNTLGFAGTPVTVTRIAGSATGATFSIGFNGSMANQNLLQLAPSITTAPGTINAATLADGGSLNFTTITTSTQLQINIPAGGTIPNPIFVNGSGAGVLPGAILNVSGNNTLSGEIHMLSAGGVNSTTIGVVSSNNTLTITGQISNASTSPYSFNKEGAGTLALNPLNAVGNTYTATTNINNGVVVISHPFALGAAGGSTFVNSVGTSGSLAINYNNNPFIPTQYLNYAQVQTLTVNGAISGITKFTLTYNGVTTTPITYTGGAVDAVNVQAALNHLSTIGGIGASVVVSPPVGGVFNVTFQGSLGGMQIPILAATVTAGAGAVTVGTTTGTTPIGFIIPNEFLTLSGGGFGGFGATFESQTGHNSWEKLITLAGGISISVGLETNFYIDGGMTGGSITKISAGRLILPTPNSFTSNVTIIQGAINVRDSAALGGSPVTGVTVSAGASVELQADGIPDSVGTAGLYNLFFPSTFTFNIIGAGQNLEGGLYNMAGVNRIDGKVQLSSNASLGVAPDPDPANIQLATWNNLSQLNVDGVISGGTLTKIGHGELVLTNQNTYQGGATGQNTYQTFINEGWITINNNFALGGTIGNANVVDQPGVQVLTGAALVLKHDPAGNNLNFAYNMNLAGDGIDHRFSWLNHKGALLNLEGDNLATGDIYLTGNAAIGIEKDDTGGASQLTLTGTIFNGNLQSIYTSSASGGGPQQDVNVIDTKSTVGGTINIAANVRNPSDDIRVYLGDFLSNPAAAILVYDSTTNGLPQNPTNLNRANITITYNSTTASANASVVGGVGGFRDFAGGANWNPPTGIPIVTSYPAGLTNRFISIVVNEGGSAQTTTQWSYTAKITPLGVDPGHLEKLGTQRLIIQGAGLYTGGVDIKDGVLRINNDTALGTGTTAANTTTVVESGTALEFGPTLPLTTGGVQRGLQVWYTHLVLNGTGNTEFGDAPLVIPSGDNLWRGPITLNSNLAVTFKNQLGNLALPVMTANSAALVGGTVSLATTTPGGFSFDAVQTLTFDSTITGGTFTLTVDNGLGTVATTAPIPWSSSTALLIFNIQNALNALAPAFGGTVNPGITAVAMNSPIIDIFPNSRFLITGTIDDGANPGSITINGGGELTLAGANTYRGTTYLDQGILTISNNLSLGAGATAEVQRVTVASIGTTFTLSFNGSAPSAPFTYTGGASDVINLTNALMSLPTIGGVGGVASVVQNGNVFTITFGGTLAGFDLPALVSSSANAVVTPWVEGAGGTVVANNAQLQLQGGINVTGEALRLQGQGNPLENEVQRFVMSGLPTNTFRLTFTNPATSLTSTTPDIPLGANAAQVRAALNALLSIQQGGGSGGGFVSVNLSGVNAYTVAFKGTFTASAQPLIKVSVTQQVISYAGTDGTFKLNFTGDNTNFTVDLPPTVAPTGGILPTDSLENAINDLLARTTAVPAGGTASVTTLSTGVYQITFGGSLAGVKVPLLIDTETQGPTADLTVSLTSSGATALTHEIVLGGTPNATPAQWFNAGPSFVSNAMANQSAANPKQNIAGPVTGIVADPNDANIMYISTAGGGVFKTTNGGQTWNPLFDNLSTVQVVTIQGADIITDTFTLTYTDPFTGAQLSTIALPFNASSDQVKAALDQVVGIGNSVSVTQTVNTNGVNEQQRLAFDTAASSPVTGDVATNWEPNRTTFRLTFKTGNNNRTNFITYTGNSTTDALNVQNALNSLSTIKGPTGKGFVTVTTSSQDILVITFQGALSAADQPSITFDIGRSGGGGGGGGGGGVFWQPPFNGLPPTPFPTINGFASSHTGFGGTDGGLNNRDSGNMVELVKGSGPTIVDTVTFGGGALAGVNITPMTVAVAGATTVQQTISSVTMINGGTNYLSNSAVTFTGGGGGSGATASLNILGGVNSVTMTSGGVYGPGPASVTFSAPGGGGTTAIGTPILNLSVISVAVTAGGSGYTNGSPVTFAGGGGSGAAGTIVVASGAITGITITSGGSNYTSAPIPTIVDPAGTGATLGAVTVRGPITGVNITNPGTNYSTPPNVTFSAGLGSNATGVAILSGTITGVNIINGGSGYTSPPTVSFANGTGASGIVNLGVPVAQTGINAQVAMFGGAIAINQTKPNILFFGTGEGDFRRGNFSSNSGVDNYYSTGVYMTTDAGQTWNLLTDPSLANPNPLFGLAINRIVVDASKNIIYVATSDKGVNGIAGVGTQNTPTVHNPGVWRFDLTKRTWFNLTNVTSLGRNAGPSVQTRTAPQPPPSPPATPGPDDWWYLDANDSQKISFPQQNATWTDIFLDSSNRLYAALGNAGNVTGVYHIDNPDNVDNGLNKPVWLLGKIGQNDLPGTPGAGPVQFDNRLGNFPLNQSPSFGNIKFTVVNGSSTVDTVWVSVTNSNTDPFDVLLLSTDGGRTYGNAATQPPNFQANEGTYASAITMFNGVPTVGGHSTSGSGYIYSGATDISLGAGNIGPHTDVHAMITAGGRLVVGTDGGVWAYNGATWANLNGNLANIQFDSVYSDPTNPNRVFGGGKGIGTVLFNGNQSWTQVDGLENGNLNGDNVFIDPNNANIIYHVQDGSPWAPTARLFGSTDGGATWNAGPLDPVWRFPLVIDTRSRVFMGGTSTRVFNPILNSFSGLGGGSTAIAVATLQGPYQADPGFSSLVDLGASNPDPNTVYLANGNTISVTKNFGLGFVTRSIPGLPAGVTIADIQIDPGNRDVLYAVTTGQINASGVGEVWKTTDAGQSWTKIGSAANGLPTNLPMWKLALDPRNGNLYVGTDLGVYELPAGSGTWKKFGFGMPNVAVHDLNLNPVTNILIAGTYGRSAYQFFLDTPSVNSGALRASGGQDIWNGPIILTGPTTISADGNPNVQNGIAITKLSIFGGISDSTPGTTANTLTKIGTGDIILASGSIYGGDTLLNEGNLVIQHPNALGLPGKGTTVSAGSVLQLNTSLADEPVTVFGDGVQANGHFTGALENLNNNNTYNGVLTLMTNSTIGVNIGSSLTIASPGTITDGAGVFSLTKEEKGTLILQTANSYDGNTFVNQGVLNIQNAGALGSPNTTTTVTDGAQLQLQAGPGGPVNVTTENLILSGVGINGTGALLNVDGNNSWGSATTGIRLNSVPSFAPQTSPPGIIVFGVANAADTLKINGAITEPLRDSQGNPAVPQLTMASGISKVGPGTLALASGNAYVGTTYVDAGTLAVQNSAALGGNHGQAIQRVTTYSSSSAATFQLTFKGVPTGNLNFGSSATVVQNALNGLSSIGANGVTVGLNTVFNGINEVQRLTLNGVTNAIGTPTLTSPPGAGAGGAFAAGTYFWIVTAVTPTGETVASNEATRGVTGGQQVTLNWSAVAGATSYRIYRSATSGVYTAASLVAVSTGTSYVDPGAVPTLAPIGATAGASTLPAGNYYYVVTALTASGESAQSNIRAVTITAGQLANLSWSAFAGATGYKVYRTTTTAGFPSSSLVATLGATTTFNDNGVVAAVGAPPKLTAPMVRTTINLTFKGITTAVPISLTGVPATDATNIAAALNGLSSIGATNVAVTAVSANVFDISFQNALKQSFQPLIVSSLLSGPGTAVVTEKSAGAGGATNIYTIVFSGAALAGPQPLIAAAGSSNQITATVSTVAEGGESAIVANGATLQLDNAGGSPIGVPVGGPTLTASTISGGAFVPGTYYYVITAVGPNGESIASNQQTAVVGLGQQVQLSWVVVPGATSYKVYRSTTSGSFGANSYLATVAPGSSTGYVDSGISAPVQNPAGSSGPGTLPAGTYYYVITALVGGVQSVASNEQSVTVAAGEHADLSWAPVFGATSYRVYRSTTAGVYGASSLVTTVSPGSTTVFSDNGGALLAGTPTLPQTGTPPLYTLLLNGNGVGGVGALYNLAGNNTWTGNVVLQTGSSIGANAGTSVNITGIVQNPFPAPVPPASIVPPNLTKVGDGTVILSNDNNFTGNVFINTGILNIQDRHGLGVNTNTTQTVTVSGTSGAFTLFITGVSSAINSGALAFSATAGDLQTAINTMLGNAGAPGGGLGTATVTTQASGNTFVVTFGGSLAGQSAPLLFAGNFTGNTQALTTEILAGGASGARVASGAALQLQSSGGFLEASGKPVTINGAGFNGTGALDNVAGLNVWGTTPIILGSNSSIGSDAGTLFVTQPITDSYQTQTIQFNGFSAGNNYRLTFGGFTSGPLTYSAATGTNATTIQNALQNLLSVSLVNGTVNVDFVSGTTYRVSFTGTMAGLSWPAITASTTGAGAFTLGAPAFVSNAYTLDKVGAAAVQYAGSAANAYTGLTTVVDGALQLAKTTTNTAILGNLTVGDGTGGAGSAMASLLSNNQIADAATVTVKSDGLFELTYLTETISALNVNAGTATTGITTSTASSAATGGALTAGSVTVTNGGNLNATTVNSSVTVNGPLSVTDATVTTSGASSHVDVNGLTTLTGALVSLANATSQLNLGGNVTAASDVTAAATITGAGKVSLGGSTRTFDVTHGAAATVTSDLVVNAVVAGTGSEGIAKSGAGRLELNAVNTYTGASTVNAGDVQVDSGASINDVTLLGGSLSGKGSVGIVSGAAGSGTVNPGYNGVAANTGILNTKDVTWGANATYFVNLTNNSNTHPSPLAGSDYDQLGVTGNVTLGNALLAGTSAANIVVGDKFTIIQTTGGLVSGKFDTFIGATRVTLNQGDSLFIGGQKYFIDYSDTTKVVLTRQYNFATIAITPSVTSPSAYGQDVIFTGAVNVESGSGALPVGLQVTFTLDGNPSLQQTVTLSTAGLTTFAPTFDPQVLFGIWNPASTHTIDAAFTDPSNNFQAASATQLSHAVVKGAVNVAVSSTPTVTPTTPVYGPPVTITAQVTPVVTLLAGANKPSSTVTFVLDAGGPGLTLTVPVTVATGIAQWTIPAGTLSVGPHTVHVNYDSGDAFYLPSSTIDYALPVQKDNSVITLTPPATPIALGQSATIQATVTPATAGSVGVPQGTLTFYDGSTLNPPLGSVPYSGSAVNFVTSTFATAGTHTIIATFTPSDGNYNPSQQSTPLVVGKATTQTIITSTVPANPTFGQQVTFNITVSENPVISSSFGLPTGTVTLWDGAVGTGIIIGAGAINATNGQTTILTTIAGLSTGTHTINAVYSGDGTFATSTGTNASFVVNPAATTTVITASPVGSANFGTSVRFNAQVTSAVGIPPAGTHIAFWDGAVGGSGISLGSGIVDASGKAFVDVTTLSAGSHTVFAVFTDDDDATVNYANSTGSLSGYKINNASTATALTTNPSVPSGAGVYGQPITLQATVTSPGGTVGVGVVTFKDGAATLGTGLVNGSGVATLTINTLTAISHVLTAVYNDNADTYFATSTGTLSPYVVGPASTQILSGDFTSDLPISALVAPVTFTAKATTQSPSTIVVNAGTITFWDGVVGTGGTNLGTGTVSASGVASVTVSSLAIGTHTIFAVYNGATPNYLASAPQSLTQIVRRATSITFSPIAPPNNFFGQTLNYVVSVAPATLPASPAPTGTLTISEVVGSTTTPLVSLSGYTGGPANMLVSGLPAGAHTLLFDYSGDGSTYAPSSKTITQKIEAAPTATTVTTVAPLTTPIYGELITFEATVTSSTATAPTVGSVTFKDGTTILGTVTLSSSNVVQFTTPATQLLKAGDHSIVAIYNTGDANYASSTTLSSSPHPQHVNAATTETVLDAPPSNYGNKVTFTATVNITSGGTLTHPTAGTVTFVIPTGAFTSTGEIILKPTIAINPSTGVATYTTALPTTMHVGSHNVTAKYNGNTNFSSSTTSGVQVVSKAGIGITLTASPASGTLTYGKTVTFTALVSIASSGSPGSPTGTVSFWDGAIGAGGTLLKGNVTLVAVNSTTAKAVFTTTARQLSAISHTIFADYHGDAKHAAQSQSIAYTVKQAVTATTLAAVYSPLAGTASYTATVAATSGGAPGAPTGTVTFVIDSVPQTPVNLVNGKASMPWDFTTNHTVSAFYTPAITPVQNFQASSAADQEVRKPTILTFTSVSTTTGVNITASVTSPGGIPTGTIKFYENGILIGEANVTSSGKAFITLNLPTGNHKITAVYSGDADFNSATLTKTIAGKLIGRLV